MSKKRNRFGACSKCLKGTKLEKHHLYPRRFFNRKNNRMLLMLCPECHRDIERYIPRYTQLTRPEYIELTKKWLIGKPIKIYLP